MGNQKLTDNDRAAIRGILENKTDIERGRMDEAVWCIDASIQTAMILGGSGSPKENRDELAALHRVIADLLKRTSTLSVDSKMILDHFVNEDDLEPAQPNQASQFPYLSGEGLRRLQIYAEAIEKAASKALAEIKAKRKVKPGTKPNITGRSIAFHLRETFEAFDVPVTSYDSGPYMEILDIVFSELLPTEGQQAHTRHGKWAVRIEDISGTTFATIVGNGNE